MRLSVRVLVLGVLAMAAAGRGQEAPKPVEPPRPAGPPKAVEPPKPATLKLGLNPNESEAFAATPSSPR